MVTLYGNEGREAVIPVAPRPEPANFAVSVRVPGQAFIRLTPRPTQQQYRTHDYWKLCLEQLRHSYREVCAYSSIWIPTNYTVDHFLPKGRYPNLAYEWSNYRLAADFVNNNKGASESVLDPFVILNGWFILDPATLYVKPEPTLSTVIKVRVQTSIDVLKLNHYRLVNVRFQIFRGYIDGKQHLDTIAEKYPFIAAEIRRQKIKTAAEVQAEAAKIRAVTPDSTE
jgi:hypothetical protein